MTTETQKLADERAPLLFRIAQALKWATCYHVVYQFPIGGGFATADMTVVVSPWIRRGAGINRLREFLQSQSAPSGCRSAPNIIGITRIGL